jgi:hypothetical protein
VRRGGLDIKQNSCEATLLERTGWSLTNTVARKRPPRLRASFQRLRGIFFSAQPPLLVRRGLALNETGRLIDSHLGDHRFFVQSQLTVTVHGLPVEPSMPVRVTEREVAFTPVLIARLADFNAETFQTFILRIHIIDLSLDV